MLLNYLRYIRVVADHRCRLDLRKLLLLEVKELLRLKFHPLLEAAINDIVLIGAGIFFLISAETRIKRRRVLNSLHRLEYLRISSTYIAP
jgi:hypothetical protein